MMYRQEVHYVAKFRDLQATGGHLIILCDLLTWWTWGLDAATLPLESSHYMAP